MKIKAHSQKVYTRQGFLKGPKKWPRILPCRPILEKRFERTPPPDLPKSGILMAWRFG